jgi:hypothetical protein
LVWFEIDLAIDGQGATRNAKTSKWIKQAPDLLSAPGKYALAISGSLALADRTVKIALEPLELEVAAESESSRAWRVSPNAPKTSCVRGSSLPPRRTASRR